MAADLASPLQLRCGATLPNRIAKAAMTEGLAGADDRPDEALATLYRRWAEGGAGLLISGNIMVDRRYLERPGNVAIEHDGDLPSLRAWAEAGTATGNQFWLQINHPGRQCHRFISARPPAPSAVRLDLGAVFGNPIAMSEAQIEDAIERYANAAALAQTAGFTGVQIHGAHGYLISQFLSPLANQRMDRWGGTVANRARFLREVVRATRDAVGAAFPIGVKLNSADFQRGGFAAEDSVKVARWLDQAGIDLLEVSGGTYEQLQFLGQAGKATDAAPPKRASTVAREAYFLDYARTIRDSVEVPIMLTGGFQTPDAMREVIGAGEVDVIGLGRPFALDPDFPQRLLAAEADDAPLPRAELSFGSRLPRWLRESLPIRLINAQGEAAWYYRQILALARGEQPNRGLGLLTALQRHYRDEMRILRRRHA
ncbi:MAG: NADH:flavin oxidoreductase/NADH oxidase family protein [Pseudomonadota bacterium]